MEQRQPMLHALMLAPGGDRRVERFVACSRPDQLHIALSEGAADVRREHELAHWQKLDTVEPRSSALRLPIEGPDRFERVAEEVKANRLGSRRIEIEDAAAHCILAWIGHGARAPVTGNFEALDELLHSHGIAGYEPHARRGDERPWGHSLHHGVHRGEDDKRRLVA